MMLLWAPSRNSCDLCIAGSALLAQTGTERGQPMFASRHFAAHLALKSPKRLSGQVLDHNQPQDESSVHDTPEIGAEHEKVNVRGCRLG